MEISVIGLNHRTAPVDIRERFALPAELAKQLLQTIHAEKIFSEALILDTCNRTEIYFLGKDQPDPLPHLLGHISRLKGNSAVTDRSVFYHYRGLDAVRHLFRIAASLDSQLVGEHQILGQLKNAYRLALDAGTSKFLLNKLLHWAFRVGKKVQTHTDLGRGSVSVATSAVELARQIFSRLSGKKVLLIGAGETAELAARALLRCGIGHLIVANRTLSRAEQLAESLRQNWQGKVVEPKKECPATIDQEQLVCPVSGQQEDRGAADDSGPSTAEQELTTQAIGIKDIPDVIWDVDLIICSTGSTEPVLTYQSAARSRRRANRSLLIVDISVPRNVEPSLAELPNVFLYNIDDLDRLVARNLERRQAEIPRAEAIVDYEVQRFGKWLDSLQVAPIIKLLQQHFEQLQQAQIGRYGSKFASADQQQLEEFSRALCSKILHRPLAFLRKLSEDSFGDDGLASVDTIRRMFDLDSAEEDK